MSHPRDGIEAVEAVDAAARSALQLSRELDEDALIDDDAALRDAVMQTETEAWVEPTGAGAMQLENLGSSLAALMNGVNTGELPDLAPVAQRTPAPAAPAPSISTSDRVEHESFHAEDDMFTAPMGSDPQSEMDLDGSLAGHFESVDDVLSGVFETRAAIVQDSHDVAAVVAPRAEATEEALPPEPAAIAMQIEQPGMSETAADPLAATDASFLAAEEANAQFEPPAVPSLPPPAVKAERSAPISSPAVPVAQESAPAEGLVAAEPAQPSRIALQITAMLGTIDAALRRGLSTLSLPLQFVPTKLRPVVDWIAISLVAWTPIVWAIAWLRSHA